MNQNFEQLLSILDEEADAYRQMQVLLSEEKKAASLSNRERLVAVGQQKQDAVDHLKRMETTRQQRVDVLAREAGVDSHPVTVSLLARHLDDGEAASLETRATTLKSLMKTVQAANNANAHLFEHYLGLIHGSLQLLNDMVYGHAVYRRPGSTEHAAGYAGSGGRVFCGDI